MPFARRALIGLSALLLAGAGAVVAAPTASASTCITRHHTIHFQDGIVPLEIGTDKLTFNACYDRHGIISSSSIDQELGTSPAGEAAGWNLEEEANWCNGHCTNRTAVTWIAPFRGRVCLVKIVPVCGYWADAETQVTYYGIGFVGPKPKTVDDVSYWPHCTNDTCGFQFDGGTRSSKLNHGYTGLEHTEPTDETVILRASAPSTH